MQPLIEFTVVEGTVRSASYLSGMFNRSCSTGKIVYASLTIAEDVLIELWSKNEYNRASAPVAVYRCDDCGFFHLTSKGPMNEKLSAAISSGTIKRQREANWWERKFK